MSVEENKKCTRRAIEEIWNPGIMRNADDLWAPNYVN
jgi:hypothetical protein